MRLRDVRSHCLAKAGVTEGHPFGAGALVMKVAGKVFAIIMEERDPLDVSVKCEPDLAESLRAAYPAVNPGYHLNKRHWNTVTLDGSVTPTEVRAWIDDSYDLVVASLPRRVRETLK